MSDVRFQIEDCADGSPVSSASQDSEFLQPCPPAASNAASAATPQAAAAAAASGTSPAVCSRKVLLQAPSAVDCRPVCTTTDTTSTASTCTNPPSVTTPTSALRSSAGGSKSSAAVHPPGRQPVIRLAGADRLSPASCVTEPGPHTSSLSANRPPRKALKVEFIGMEEIEERDKSTERTNKAVENDLNRFHGRKGAHQSARFRQPRMSLLGKPINYRAHKRDARYRRAQAKIYNFLERPKDWRAISYHLLV
jgi:hypothetical protein